MSDEIVFFHNPKSRSATVHWMLEELGLPHRIEPVEMAADGSRSAAVLAVNPMGKIPTITHRGVTITETPAILAYLADLRPEARLAPSVGDPQRGAYYRWLVFGAAAFEPAVIEVMMKREPVDKRMAGWGNYDDVLGALRGELSRREWLAGDRFSAADLYIASSLAWTGMFGAPGIKGDAVFDPYVARCTDRDAHRRVNESRAELEPARSVPPSGVRVGAVFVPGRVWVAPMTGVSDLPFRRIASELGAAYVATEMVACAELARGRPDAVRRAAVGDGLPLTVIQLVGADPAMIAQGARMAEAAGADIIDLNLGCPAKEVTGAACGSALMRDPEAAQRLIGAAVQATRRPVTVKMRLGWDEAARNAPEIARRAQEAGAAALTVHGRTRAQFYTGIADWTAVREVKRAVSIPVMVNGDVTDAPSACKALADSGADGVMLGRGVYGRPWLAATLERALAGKAVEAEPEQHVRLAIASRHLQASLAFYGDQLGLRVWRKHLGWYVERAPWPADPLTRRAAKAVLCRLDDPAAVERGLAALWLGEDVQQAA